MLASVERRGFDSTSLFPWQCLPVRKTFNPSSCRPLTTTLVTEHAPHKYDRLQPVIQQQAAACSGKPAAAAHPSTKDKDGVLFSVFLPLSLISGRRNLRTSRRWLLDICEGAENLKTDARERKTQRLCVFSEMKPTDN